MLGMSRRTLFECRSADSAVSDTSWAKLEAAELRARSEVSTPQNAQSSADPKESAVRESAHAVRGDPAVDGRDQAQAGARADADCRDREITIAFGKIREGLDLLEKWMKKGN